MWPLVNDKLSNYEKFWQAFILLLTNRIDPNKHFGTDEWIRLRPGLPPQYEDLAMSNYSAFCYAACVVEQMRDNEKRIASGRHYRPELVFFYMEMCIENATKLQHIARMLLREPVIVANKSFLLDSACKQSEHGSHRHLDNLP